MAIFLRMCRVVAIATVASAAAAQTRVPVRPLGPVLSTSSEPLGSVSQVRAIGSGRVIVNDITGRRVVMFDSTFQHVSVIADSTDATSMAYGSRLGGLIAYRGDSTLFVDPASLSMLLIDPNGRIVGTMAAPLPREVNQLIGGPFGTPGFDAKGRLVFRTQVRQPANWVRPPTRRESGSAQLPESAMVVRVDLKTRSVDTAATYRIPKFEMSWAPDEKTGLVTVLAKVNPIPWVDAWALLSDGTLAVVRGQDYRVEFVAADGQVTTGPKLPFEWQRLTDDAKVAIIDSTRTARENQRAAILKSAGLDAKAGDTGKPSTRQRPQSDGSTIMTAPGGGAGAAPVGIAIPPLTFVSPSDMPDYRPVFQQGAARGDEDGNLWIRTSKMVNGGAVYDVINRKGELVDRIQVPPGRVIAGFGPGGVVYMGVVDGTITRLERARAVIAGK